MQPRIFGATRLGRKSIVEVFREEEYGFTVYLGELKGFHKIDAALAKFAFGNVRVRLFQ